MWYWWLLIIVLVALGLYQFSKGLAFAIKICIREARYSPPMYEWYGHETKDSYVVVTGGSDGIGFQICNMMAARGFNIVMIARNQKKMDEKVAYIKLKYP